MTKWINTQFVGVRYWESDTRNIKGKNYPKEPNAKKTNPDRCYVIRSSKDGKRQSETVGWHSDGIDAQFCSNLRGEIVTNIKTGQGFQSLKEKREIKTAKKNQEQLEKEVKEAKNITFNALAEKYFEFAKDHKPKSYKTDLSRFENHLAGNIGYLTLHEINAFTLDGLKNKLSKKRLASGNGKGKNTLSEKTVKHCMILIRHMYNQAIGWKLYNGTNPVSDKSKTDKTFLKIEDNGRLRFLAKEEARELLDYLWEKNTQLHDICLMAIYSGLRAGEIFALKWIDVDFDLEQITIKKTKNGKTRYAYFHESIKKMLTRLFESNPPKNSFLFQQVIKKKGQGYVKNDKKIEEVPNAYPKAIKALKFNGGVKDRRDRVVFHTLRHTFGSWLAMDGQSLLTIKNLMGHKDISMTLRYAHLSPNHERNAVQSIGNDLAGTDQSKLRRVV